MSKRKANRPHRSAHTSAVQPLYQRCQCCNSVLQPPVLNHHPVPFIILHGTWLRDMGMDVGDRLIVEAGRGLLTVALVGPRDRVDAVMPHGPDGVIHQMHFTEVHADPIRQMSAAA